MVCFILGDFACLVGFLWAMFNAPTPDTTGAWIWGAIFIAMLGMLLIPFIVFHKLRLEHAKEIESIQKKLEEQKTDLVANIEDHLWISARNGAGIAFRMSLLNPGKPTVVHKWSVSMTLPSGEIVPARQWTTWPIQLSILDDAETLYGSEGVDPAGHICIDESKTMRERTKTAIPTGGAVWGWVVAYFPNHIRDEAEDSVPTVSFEFSFCDVNENETKLSYSC